jgi:hypothetical protein
MFSKNKKLNNKETELKEKDCRCPESKQSSFINLFDRNKARLKSLVDKST